MSESGVTVDVLRVLDIYTADNAVNISVRMFVTYYTLYINIMLLFSIFRNIITIFVTEKYIF